MTNFYDDEEIVVREEEDNEDNEINFITDVSNIDVSFNEALLFF